MQLGSNDIKFDGETYNHEKDNSRLTSQLNRVFNAMKDGKYRTLREIEDLVDAPQASISARLRDLRKRKFGGFSVHRVNMGGGLFHYRLMIENETS